MPGAHSAARRLSSSREPLRSHFERVRSATEALCRSLQIEDYGIQTMPDVSPVKWHIAHTSWFFETFLLVPNLDGYKPFHPAFDYLFNSYYVTHGKPYLRRERGLLSRPTVAEVYEYRRAVDEQMLRLMEMSSDDAWSTLEPLITLGLNHEQQHQELMLTDIKHVFAHNPLRPVYRGDLPEAPRMAHAQPLTFHDYAGGVHEIGHAGSGFAYDNEAPRHRVWLEAFALASRPVSNRDYIEFIEDGGYREPRWWLSEGWSTVQNARWQAPLYWEQRDGAWWHMTLAGMRPVDLDAPVCHVSHFEADAYAAWAGKRLPTEAEWEHAAESALATDADLLQGANLRDAGYLQPVAAQAVGGVQQLFGDVWEWTASPYTAYPGFRVPDGPVGEYNGKFMSGQLVLRGGSCATPADHIRSTYRNFFYPKDRWQFSGIRLAEDR